MKTKIAILAIAACLVMGSSAAGMDYTSKDTVKQVQESLNSKGYDCGKADGIAGTKTRNQIQKYRSDHSLPSGSGIDQSLTVSLGLEESDSASDQKAASNADVSSITFRKIYWMQPEKNVKIKVERIPEIEPSPVTPVEEGARIDEWFHKYENVYTDINVPGGGTILNYTGISVAGYPADLVLSFMYPVQGGKVSFSTEDSRLYKAEYILEEQEDYESVYKDLCTKLAKLYGEGQEKSYYNAVKSVESPRGTVWTGKDGSTVWAGIYYNSYLKKYDECHIVYAAPDTTDKLQVLSDHIKMDRAEAQEQSRKDNSDNLEGL